jgi:hypothetical protein
MGYTSMGFTSMEHTSTELKKFKLMTGLTYVLSENCKYEQTQNVEIQNPFLNLNT